MGLNILVLSHLNLAKITFLQVGRVHRDAVEPLVDRQIRLIRKYQVTSVAHITAELLDIILIIYIFSYFLTKFDMIGFVLKPEKTFATVIKHFETFVNYLEIVKFTFENIIDAEFFFVEV
jgi:hypothetical protein